jgi:phage tail sheath protein FI
MTDELRQPGVYITEAARPAGSIAGVPTSVTAFVGDAAVGPANTAVAIASWRDYVATFGELDNDFPMSWAVWLFFANGGMQAQVVRAGAGDEAVAALAPALDPVDVVNILCLPAPNDTYDLAQLSVAVRYAAVRRAMLILDPPAGWTGCPSDPAVHPEPAVLPSHPNAVVYYPNLLVTGPDGARVVVGPAGAVAGVWARSDQTRGVWKAPAGTAAPLAGITGFATELGDKDSAALNPLGVNVLLRQPISGPVVWGARTLAPTDDSANPWRYIAVRRTALFIEESLRRGTAWAVFEPNAEPLWASLRLAIEGFMQGLWREGAFVGPVATDAYFVRCDAALNPAASVAQGVVNIVVGFAPLEPAEFVIIDIAQLAGQPPT